MKAINLQDFLYLWRRAKQARIAGSLVFLAIYKSIAPKGEGE